MPSIEFAQAFASARDRSARNAPWIHQVGPVEHHQNGHWVLRGTFAGHYLDVDDALHVSERGGAEGFAAGAVLGSLMGPPGFAAGMVLGAIIGSQTAQPHGNVMRQSLSQSDFGSLQDSLRLNAGRFAGAHG